GRLVGDVARDRDGAVARLLGRALELVDRAGEEGDARAALTQSDCDATTEPGRRADDDGSHGATSTGKVTRMLGTAAPEQQHARRRAAARRHHRGPRVRDLALAGVVAELHDRLVDEAVAVRPSFGELAAVRVDGQVAVDRDARAVADPVLRLADAAEPERLEPRDRVER